MCATIALSKDIERVLVLSSFQKMWLNESKTLEEIRGKRIEQV